MDLRIGSGRAPVARASQQLELIAELFRRLEVHRRKLNLNRIPVPRHVGVSDISLSEFGERIRGSGHANTHDFRRQRPPWRIVARPQSEQPPVGPEPKISVAVAESRPNVALDALGMRVVGHAIVSRIQPVDSARRACVNSSVSIFGNAPYLVARETLRVVVYTDRNLFAGRLIDSAQTGVRARNPKTILAVPIQRLDRARRRSRNLLETPVAPPQQAAGPSEPDPYLIWRRRGHGRHASLPYGSRQLIGKIVYLCSRPLPARQSKHPGRCRTDP
jgi:hypothetical protein